MNKKKKPSNNTKALLGLNLIMASIFDSGNKTEKKYDEAVKLIVNNTISKAKSLHTTEELTNIYTKIKENNRKSKRYIDDKYVVSLCFLVLTRTKLKGFYGLELRTLIENRTIEESIPVEDIETFLEFINRLNRDFNTKISREGDSLHVEKTKKLPNKKKKKKEIKKKVIKEKTKKLSAKTLNSIRKKREIKEKLKSGEFDEGEMTEPTKLSALEELKRLASEKIKKGN